MNHETLLLLLLLLLLVDGLQLPQTLLHLLHTNHWTAEELEQKRQNQLVEPLRELLEPDHQIVLRIMLVEPFQIIQENLLVELHRDPGHQIL